jgi:MFS family permease
MSFSSLVPVSHVSSSLLTLLDHFSLHYSYCSLPISSLNIFINGAGASYGIGYFAKSWEQDIGVSKTALSLAWAFALLLTGLVTPLISPLIDRFGVRFLAYLIVLPSFGGLFFLAYCTNFLTLLAALFLVRLFTSFMLLNAQTLTNYWWVERKGFAVSITSSIGNLALIWPTILSIIHIQGFSGDWRATIRVEAIILGLLGLLAALFTLNQPERYGKLPDGKHKQDEKQEKKRNEKVENDQRMELSEQTIINEQANSSFFIPSNNDSPPVSHPSHSSTIQPTEILPSATHSSTSLSILNAEVNWHWRDAIRTVYFWTVNFSLFSCYLLWGGFSFHFSSLMSDSNIESTVGFQVSAYIFLPICLSAMVSMIWIGRVFDHSPNKCRCMLIGSAMCQLALACILAFPAVASLESKGTSYFILLFYSMVYGIMNSVQTIAYSVVLAFAFGRKHNGTIYGISTLCNQFSLALGPILFSLWKDSTGSYNGAIVTIQILTSLAAFGIFLTPKPDPSKRKYPMEELMDNENKSGENQFVTPEMAVEKEMNEKQEKRNVEIVNKQIEQPIGNVILEEVVKEYSM